MSLWFRFHGVGFLGFQSFARELSRASGGKAEACTSPASCDQQPIGSACVGSHRFGQ